MIVEPNLNDQSFLYAQINLSTLTSILPKTGRKTKKTPPLPIPPSLIFKYTHSAFLLSLGILMVGRNQWHIKSRNIED